MADLITPRLANALQFTVQLFGQDARKSSPVPTLAHLLGVCALVQHDGGDEDEAIAALLHDTLEDKPDQVTPEDIEDRFGHRVLAFVRVATDTPPDYRGGPKAKWKERKEQYLSHARRTDPALLRVTMADKVDNLRALVADYQRIGEAVWARFNAPKPDQLWYYRQALEAYRTAGCRGPLLDELERLVRVLETTVA